MFVAEHSIKKHIFTPKSIGLASCSYFFFGGEGYSPVSDAPTILDDLEQPQRNSLAKHVADLGKCSICLR